MRFVRKKAEQTKPEVIEAELLPVPLPREEALAVPEPETDTLSTDGVEVKPVGPLLMVKTQQHGALHNQLPTDEVAEVLEKTPRQKKRSKKSLLGAHVPKLACDTCAFHSACPYFKPGYACALMPLFEGHTLETEEDLAHYMVKVAEAEVQRAQQAVVMERLSGGALDKETSKQLDIAYNRMERLYSMLQIEKPRVNVLQKSGPLFQQVNAFVQNGESAKSTTLLQQLLSDLQKVGRTPGGS